VRYFLLDRVTELVPGQHAVGIKCVTLTDQVLHDHFPEHPIFPGALLVEGMAQLAGFLLEATLAEPDKPVRRAILAQIDKAKFKGPAVPGDRIRITVRIQSTLETAARVEAEAHVEDTRIAHAALTFMMREVASARVHEERRALYRLWTAGLSVPIP
jgi:3-hydroxyacyl-[acyl-carrier-protein] dehydratase